jgi:exosortase/archaeosortase family protein
VEDFSVLIGSPCSGIDGMTLFVTLYCLIVCFDWKNVNKLRAAIFLPFGTLGMFLMNTLRVYLLLVVGVLYSEEFAIGAFHSNIGWILFLVYFLTFLYFIYPHLLIRKLKKK